MTSPDVVETISSGMVIGILFVGTLGIWAALERIVQQLRRLADHEEKKK